MKLTAQHVTAQDVRTQKPRSWFFRPGGTAPGRVFHAFDGLALVPAADLLMLRHAFGRSGAELGEADIILQSVEQELLRRSAVLPPPGA